MFNSGFDKDRVVRAKSPPFCSFHKETRPRRDEVQFVLLMGCLRVNFSWPLEPKLHRSVSERVVETHRLGRFFGELCLNL